MDEKPDHNDQKPIYNIKAVSRLVDLLPVTLRAWERRYGLPNPGRGEQGYRLYSEYDVRTLHWLKAQLAAGLNIGRAVDYLIELRTNGYDPALEPTFRPTHLNQSLPEYPQASAFPSIQHLLEQFMETLIHFDENAAQEVMRRAFTLYTVEQVLTGVVQPTLVNLGDAWHRGELPIAVEHFASQFCMQHLMSMMAAAALPVHTGSIVAACAPGEQHQIGLLMLVVMLKWRGWDVKYLGPDLPLDRLEEALKPIHPQLILFSANRKETAQSLLKLPEILADYPPPLPAIVLGGQAFNQIRLPEHFPAVCIQASPVQTVEQIEQIMAQANLRFNHRSRAE